MSNEQKREREREREREKERERERDKDRERQTDRQTDKQIYGDRVCEYVISVANLISKMEVKNLRLTSHEQPCTYFNYWIWNKIIHMIINKDVG